MADILTYDDEELVAVSIEEKNWKGIGISLLVIVVILALIGFAIFLLTPTNELDNYGAYRIDLKEVIQNVFQNKLFKVQWISANELLCHHSNGTVTILQLASSSNITSKPLIHHSIINRFNIQRTKLSPDKQLILLESSSQSNLQYTVTCDYYIYNVTSEVVFGLKEAIVKYFESRSGLQASSNLLQEAHRLRKSINLQVAAWGRNATNLVLVINNDLYFIDQLSTVQTDALNLQRLTTDGKPSIMANGISDWVYSNFFMNANYLNKELNYDELSLGAFWWSLDGQFLLYASFNDSLVNQNTISLYSDAGDYQADSPSVQHIPFPLPGKSIPIVKLFIQPFDSGKPTSERISVALPAELIDLDHYLVNVQWAARSDLILLFALRSFTSTLIVRCRSDAEFTCTTLIQAPLERRSFSLSDLSSSFLRHNTSNDLHFMRYPQQDAKHGLYSHVASFKDAYLNFFTHGSFDVTKLLAFDDRSNKLYFQATRPNQIHSRHIYELKLSANRGSSDYLKCITCDLHRTNRSDFGDQNRDHSDGTNEVKNSESSPNKTPEQSADNSTADYSPLDDLADLPINFTTQNAEINENITSLRKWITNCDNYDASFSSDFRYFALICNGPNVPYIELWQNEPVRRRVTTLHRNVQLEATLADKRLPKEHFLTVPLDENRHFYVKLITPPPKTREEILQKDKESEEDELQILYPMIVECVSLNAFNETTTSSRYQIGWPQYLASRKEMIYAQIALKHRERAVRKQKAPKEQLASTSPKRRSTAGEFRPLSTLFEEQLRAIKYLSTNFKNVDSRRIILVGTGSSAFTALGSLAEDDSKLISAAVAIAPIINWRLIDSITAEYNLGTPENFAQFEKENLAYKAGALVKKKFLLIHGTADEKVPVQQTMQLVRSLITHYEQNIERRRDNTINYQIQLQLYPDENHELANSRQHMYLYIENFIESIFNAKNEKT